ncbi:helix-turn-helix domain-containing protein [Holophaga foetida]|uniref:helix-turn-helix domain-containing protein n=1 Tax=Holophaga foetida TaxID=35839 RepID=UPI0002473749|nr:helix-turn-helix domain-containing protein [Holophaga foetida]
MHKYIRIMSNHLSKNVSIYPTRESAEAAPASILPPMVLHFTVNEFLTANRIGRTKFYELVQQGVIRPIKVGRRTLVPRVEMEAWVRRLANPSSWRSGR